MSDLQYPTLFSSEEIDELIVCTPEPIAEDPNHLNIIKESFPRIYKRIVLLWGTIELYNYLNDIIHDDRHFTDGVERQRFSKPVLEALLAIFHAHSRYAGVVQHIPVGDPWLNCK